MGKIVIKILVGIVLAVSLNIQADELKPLLMEGKKTLYQRVLSTPDARIYQQANDSSEFAEVVPFSVLYVYEKQDGWIRVGYNSFGNIVGWVPEKQAIVWNQALTVSFKDPQDIQRVMLFNSKKALKKLVDDFDKKAYQSLYQSAVNGESLENSPVIAIHSELSSPA